MQFTAKEDIEAPIDRVFATLSDFENYERAAMRRGAEVVRTDNLRAPGVGMSWQTQFKLRGRDRNVALKLVRLDAPQALQVDFASPSIEGEMVIDLLAMSRNRTRMTLAIELRPKTLSARLMVQSLKLARANITKRFALRVAEFAKDIEDRMRGAA
jgi:hypothetical protein